MPLDDARPGDPAGSLPAAVARRDMRRFPQLANQVRCSSGYTQASGGVLRALNKRAALRTEHAPHRDDVVLRKPDVDVLEYLRARAALPGAVLPKPRAMAEELRRNAEGIAISLKRLAAAGAITMWSGGAAGWPGERVVRLADGGAVLRTTGAPRWAEPGR